MALEKNMARNSGRRKLFNVNSDPNIGHGVVKEEGEQVMAKDKYGFLPKSVWHLKKDKILMDLVDDKLAKGSYSSGKKKKKGMENLSTMNPNVAYNVISYYSNPGDKTLDPFSNRGTPAIIANYLNREAYCNELVKEYYGDIVERLDSIKASPNYNGLPLEANNGDARCMPYEDNFFDLVFTSPPWLAETYISTDGQLTDSDSYEEFLESYKECFTEATRVLKPGKFMVIQVNDYRAGGMFHALSYDTITVMREIGLEYHDIIINVLNSRSVTSIGQNEKAGRKIMAKTHEYLLVFRKPE